MVAAKAPVTAVIMAAACLAAAGCSAVQPAPSSAAGLLNDSSPASTVVSPSPLGPPADPFAGTPADHWADGAPGIVLPKAEPVGGFTTAQVEFAYQRTREMLIAANLDKQTLLGGTPTAFADLLTNEEKAWFLGNLNKTGVDKRGIPLSSRADIVSFAPGSTQLIGSVIKVHGTMHAQATTNNGSPELDIHTDYLFVYPVEPPHRPEEWMRLVGEAAWVVSFANWQGAATSFEPWFTTTDADGVAGNSCGTKDGYVHPQWPTAAPQPSDSPSGPALNPYVLGHATSSNCEKTTGT